MDAGREDVHDLPAREEGARPDRSPPERALPRVTPSGRMPSCSKAKSLPVRPRPDWISSRIEQDAVLVADLPQALQVALRRDDHAALALDRLHEHRAGLRRDGGPDRLDVAVLHDRKPGVKGPKPARRVGVGREADDGGGAAVEVALRHDDLALGIGDALDVVAPLARGLDGGLHRLRPAIHGQRLVEAGERAQLLQQDGQAVVAEGPRGEGQLAGLGDQGLRRSAGGCGPGSPPSRRRGSPCTASPRRPRGRRPQPRSQTTSSGW